MNYSDFVHLVQCQRSWFWSKQMLIYLWRNLKNNRDWSNDSTIINSMTLKYWQIELNLKTKKWNEKQIVIHSLSLFLHRLCIGWSDEMSRNRREPKSTWAQIDSTTHVAHVSSYQIRSVRNIREVSSMNLSFSIFLRYVLSIWLVHTFYMKWSKRANVFGGSVHTTVLVLIFLLTELDGASERMIQEKKKKRRKVFAKVNVYCLFNGDESLISNTRTSRFLQTSTSTKPEGVA